MRVYIYDIVNGTRLLELQLKTFVNNTLKAKLSDNYMANDTDNPLDISKVINNREIGIDFSDRTNHGRCWITSYNMDNQELDIKVSTDELENRRKYLRVNIDEVMELTLTKPYVRTISVKVTDISYGGAGFIGSKTLEVGQDVVLILTTAVNTLHIDGKIIAKHSDKHYGIMFDGIETQGKYSDILYNFINSHSCV